MTALVGHTLYGLNHHSFTIEDTSTSAQLEYLTMKRYTLSWCIDCFNVSKVNYIYMGKIDTNYHTMLQFSKKEIYKLLRIRQWC